MTNILSLHNVHESDYDKAGFKGVDLSKLHNKKVHIPLTFIITIQAFKAFMEENGLNIKINKILSILNINNDKELINAYDNIKELFSKAEFSEEMKEELLEAYSTLSIDTNQDASNMVNTEEKPFVTLIRSPSYIIDPEDNEGIIQNMRGKHKFFNAIKKSWATLYSPKAMLYRHLNDISDPCTAVIVQKMIKTNACAETYSHNLRSENNNIQINSFLGFFDYDQPLKGDFHELSRESLELQLSKLNFQEHKIARDPETDDLEQVFLKESGHQQKLNDKIIIELARLTKRIRGFLSKEIKAFFCINKENIFLSHCNTIIDIEKPIPTPQIIAEQKENEPEPTPLEITADMPEDETITEEKTEEEPSFDPDKEDLGVKTDDEVELEDDLAFLDRIEKEEKEIDGYAELENELKDSDKKKNKKEKSEPKPEETKEFDEPEEDQEEESEQEPEPDKEQEQNTESKNDSIFSDIKEDPDEMEEE